jgi:hypothetical protein
LEEEFADMTISGSIRDARGKMAGLIAVMLWLISPSGISGELNGQQQSSQQGTQQGGQQGQQQGQQNCPAQGSQNNGQQGQQNGANNGQNSNCNQPAPLFGGSLTIKKSSQSTDSAALGFNGVDPNGQVQQAFLNAAPSADSEKKAQAMAANRPSPVDLAAFEKEGGLTHGTTAN